MQAPSILIVACDTHLSGIFTRRFEADGWDVEVAESSADAERRAMKMRPSVILFDDDCVDSLTDEVARFRKMPTLTKTKLAVAVPVAESAHVRDVLDAGADMYLIHGHFVPQELVQKMKRLIGK